MEAAAWRECLLELKPEAGVAPRLCIRGGGGAKRNSDYSSMGDDFL